MTMMTYCWSENEFGEQAQVKPEVLIKKLFLVSKLAFCLVELFIDQKLVILYIVILEREMEKYLDNVG